MGEFSNDIHWDFYIKLLVLTSIGPGFSAKDMSGWRVES